MTVTSPRLERLLNAAARIEQEIKLERAALARLAHLEADCRAAADHSEAELAGLADRAVAAVEVALDVSRVDILSDSRRPDVLAARMILLWIVRTRTGASYPTLGRVFGRHHTSVMNACRRVESSPRLTEQAGRVLAVLNATAMAYPA